MDKTYLKVYAINKIKEYPQLKEQISDFYYLAIDEINEGGSESHEVQLAINSIDELIKENV